MAKGDAVGDIVTIDAGGTCDIKPSGSVEWIIHNIYYEYDVEMYICDGTGELKFFEDVGYGCLNNLHIHVKADYFIRIKNLDTANARKIAYDGIVSKE